MKHRSDCLCETCWNNAVEAGDRLRKEKLSNPEMYARACDPESMAMFFQELSCKA